MPAPQYILRSYGGGAGVAQLTQEMGSTDTAFTITPTTGWLEDDGDPLGTDGPFTVVVDRFTASVEKILCSGINLGTGVVTVYVDPADGWSGRGYDTGGGGQGAPQAHVPGGSTSGVQTCWSSAEAQEANQAVYDVLGGGGTGLIGVPIGSSVPFNGTPVTLPTNFLREDGSAISRTTYSALLTAITIATVGTTTNAGATITGLDPTVNEYVCAGMKVQLVASGGAIYTVQSTTSSTIVLTSGTGVTAGTLQGITIYPHGAGDGSTTFNLPDSRGRTKVGQGGVNTNAQPNQFVGVGIGTQTVTISQSQLPTTIGTAAAQTATASPHSHGSPADGAQATQFLLDDPASSLAFVDSGGTYKFTASATTANTTVTVTNSSSAVTNGGGGAALNVESPAIGCTWIIRVT